MSEALPPRGKSLPRRSDVVIRADGQVIVNFLWNDMFAEAGPLPAALSSPTQRLPVDTEDYRHCRMCPRECGFDRVAEKHPRCLDSRLRIASVGVTLGDEAPIRGARGSGAVMLSGCPLSCPSCHSPEMVSDGKPSSPEELVDIAFRFEAEGVHNLQILSPTVHLPRLRAAFGEMKRRGLSIPILLKSSGFEKVEELRRLDGLVDIYLPDLKYGSHSRWALRAGSRDYFEIGKLAIREMWRQVGPLDCDDGGVARRGVLVRHVLAPLPAPEREEVLAFLAELPSSSVSITNNFLSLERAP